MKKIFKTGDIVHIPGETMLLVGSRIDDKDGKSPSDFVVEETIAFPKVMKGVYIENLGFYDRITVGDKMLLAKNEDIYPHKEKPKT